MNFHQTYLDKPEDISKEWVEAWNSRNAVDLANLFVEDAEFVNVVGLWWHDRMAIWKAHDYGLRVIFNDSHLALRKSSVKLITENVAVVHSRMKLTGQSHHSNIENPRNRMNLFSFVLKKMQKGWVCVSAHNTDIVPGAETHIIDSSGKIKAVDYGKS